jgi:hypothetical protein
MNPSKSNESVVNESVVNEEIWNAWLEKGRLRDQAGVRRGKVIGEITLAILSVGMAIYFLAVR